MNAMSTETELDFNLFLSEKLAITDKLAESAAKIALYNFQWRYVTMVFYNSTLLCGIEVFVRLYDKSVVISRGAFQPRFPQEIRQYILFGTDVQNIKHMLQWMHQQTFDNTGKYVVICQSQKYKECDETEAVETFWDHKIINVVFIKLNKDDLTAYTYFNPEDCVTRQPMKVDSFCNDEMEDCQMFPMKFLNLHGCPIIVSTFIQPPFMIINNGEPKGADGDLLRIIAEGLNASLKMMTPHRGDGWGALDINGTWAGSLGDIYDDLANFSMTFPAITLNRSNYFQLSIDYNFVAVAWLTHPTEKQPSSLKLLHPFQPITLILISITFTFVLISALITKSEFWVKWNRKIKIIRPNSSMVFYSWTICMGLPIKRFPKKPALLYVALFWIWYTFLIRTIYQTSLITSLMNDRYCSNVETIDDILEAKYPFGGGAALKDYYIDNPTVYDNWIDVETNDLFTAMMNLSKGMKFGLALNLVHANNFQHDQNVTIHIMRQRVVVSPTVIFFKKFSPLTTSVNRVLRHLIEAGFPDKLYKNYIHTKAESKTVDKDEPINLEHYAGCYAILLSGWLLSTTVLLYEICLGKFNYKILS